MRTPSLFVYAIGARRDDAWIDLLVDGRKHRLAIVPTDEPGRWTATIRGATGTTLREGEIAAPPSGDDGPPVAVDWRSLSKADAPVWFQHLESAAATEAIASVTAYRTSALVARVETAVVDRHRNKVVVPFQLGDDRYEVELRLTHDRWSTFWSFELHTCQEPPAAPGGAASFDPRDLCRGMIRRERPKDGAPIVLGWDVMAAATRAWLLGPCEPIVAGVELQRTFDDEAWKVLVSGGGARKAAAFEVMLYPVADEATLPADVRRWREGRLGPAAAARFARATVGYQRKPRGPQ